MKTCENCGIELKNEQLKYCSRSCAAIVNNSKFKKRIINKKECKICHKDITDIMSTDKKYERKYCYECVPKVIRGNKLVKTYTENKKCKNPECSNIVADGYYKFCCNKCKYRNHQLTRKRDKTQMGRDLKQELVTYKGGKCSECGYDKCLGSLDFHHIDPNVKEFSISRKMKSYNLDRLKLEVDKCILLCANCHRELHWNEQT